MQMKQRYGRGFSAVDEDGVVGSLATRGVVEGDWSGVWQAVIVDLFPAGAAWRDPAVASLPLAAGVDLMGTRGDIPRDRGPALDPIDGVVAGPVAVDGEPGSSP